MGIEPQPQKPERSLSSAGGDPTLATPIPPPDGSLTAFSPSSFFSPTNQVTFSPTYYGIADAAAALILRGNHYRYRKHLDRALLAGSSEHQKFLENGVSAARNLTVPQSIHDHLSLVSDTFFFSDDLDGKLTPDAEERAVFSELYQEANRSGLTQSYWGGNPALDADIKRLAETLGGLVGAHLRSSRCNDSVHLMLLTGLLLRPLAHRFLSETFGADSKAATEEGSVGDAALNVAMAVVYQMMVEQNLLGRTPEDVESQLTRLSQIDIRTNYITSDFPPDYRTLLVHLSYVVRDLRSLIIDWRCLLQMPGFIDHPALSQISPLPHAPFSEAVIPLTAIGVLHLDPHQTCARGVLFQGKVRGGVCCLTKANSSGIVYQEDRLDPARSWGIPEALCVSFDSEGKLFGSHDGRLSTVAAECPGAEQVTKITHHLHREAKEELERQWQRCPELFLFADRQPFSLLLRTEKRSILVFPAPNESESLDAPGIGQAVNSAELSELVRRFGIESTISLSGLELEVEADNKEPIVVMQAPEIPSVSGYFLLYGNRRFSTILSVLLDDFGVEEREHRGKGSHSIFFRNERGFPLPKRVRTDTQPFPLSYLKPMLRRLGITETEFVQAMAKL